MEVLLYLKIRKIFKDLLLTSEINCFLRDFRLLTIPFIMYIAATVLVLWLLVSLLPLNNLPNGVLEHFLIYNLKAHAVI